MDTKTPVDIKTLIQTSSIDIYDKNKFIERLQQTFDDEDQKLYVCNLFLYLNYHPINDFIINLDNVWKFVGFSNKANSKRLLKQHFKENIDYKIIFIRKDENKNEGNTPVIRSDDGKFSNETIMLNINTFKKLCLKANTKNADKIHDYYIKLENMYNELIKEEIEAKNELLEEQQKKLQFYENKPRTFGFLCRRSGYVYIIEERSKPGHYKIGMTYNVDKRLKNLNTSSSEKSLKVYKEFPSYDCELLESLVHKILKPFNLPGRREWFFFNHTELEYACYVLYKSQAFLDDYNHSSQEDLANFFNESKLKELYQLQKPKEETILQKPIVQDKDKPNNLQDTQIPEDKPILQEPIAKVTQPKEEVQQTIEKLKRITQLTKDNQPITETNIYKLMGQQLKNKTDNYKGVFWCNEKQKWRAALKMHYTEVFLGYYTTEIEGAKAYNDYSLFINNRDFTNYMLNENIPDYTPNPRDIPEETKETQIQSKTSSYNGVSYNVQRKYYETSIKYNRKTYHLGNNVDELECAKLYNQQALYFNNEFHTNYVLNDIPGYTTQPRNVYQDIQDKKLNNKTSKYYGVTFSKRAGKFRVVVVHNKKQIHIGFFQNELDAARAYNQKVTELNNLHNTSYKLNEI
jgi:phage anti-repressor protein